MEPHAGSCFISTWAPSGQLSCLVLLSCLALSSSSVFNSRIGRITDNFNPPTHLRFLSLSVSGRMTQSGIFCYQSMAFRSPLSTISGDPKIVFWIIHFSGHSPLFHSTCQKHESFLHWFSILSNTHPCVFFSVLDNLRIWRRQTDFIPKASSFFLNYGPVLTLPLAKQEPS